MITEKKTKFGWEVDHAFPEDLGGDEDSRNLRAMQWENNNKKDNDYPRYTCAVTGEGSGDKKKNVSTKQKNKFTDEFRKWAKKKYDNDDDSK